MSGKATNPCKVCGRRLKTHRRAKAPACSKLCRDELKRLLAWQYRKGGPAA